MKLFALAAAASLVATTMVPATASAARHGHGWKMKKVCTTKMWHGHKHRTCRNVRVRW